MSPRFDILHSIDAMTAVSDDWNALWKRSHGDYFLSFESCVQSWEKVHKPQGRHLCCAVMWGDNGGLLAVLPMVSFRRGLWRVAALLGPEAAEGCDVLVAEDAQPSIAFDVLRFFVKTVRPDVINLPFVRSGNALESAVLSLPNLRVISHTDTIPYALLRHEESWATYERSLSRSYQQQTGRKHRRLQEIGVVDIEVTEGQADDCIDWLLDEKQKWGRRVDKLGSWLFSERYRAYLKAYAASGNKVLTFALKLDGCPVAVKVIVAGPSLCSLIIAAYDESLSKFSPGNILDEFWIKHIFDNYRDLHDRRLNIAFGAGVERYKLHWSKGHKSNATTYKIATSTWGELPYRLKAISKRVNALRRPGGSLKAAEV